MHFFKEKLFCRCSPLGIENIILNKFIPTIEPQSCETSIYNFDYNIIGHLKCGEVYSLNDNLDTRLLPNLVSGKHFFSVQFVDNEAN